MKRGNLPLIIATVLLLGIVMGMGFSTLMYEESPEGQASKEPTTRYHAEGGWVQLKTNSWTLQVEDAMLEAMNRLTTEEAMSLKVIQPRGFYVYFTHNY